MSIESKIPTEELNIKEMQTETPELDTPFTGRLYRLANEQYFHSAKEKIAGLLTVNDEMALEEAQPIKIAFPDFTIDLSSRLEKIRQEILRRRESKNLWLIHWQSGVKTQLPDQTELWQPQEADILLYRNMIKDEIADMIKDRSKVIVLGKEAAAYKILMPDDDFIEESFSNPALQKAIITQLTAVTKHKSWGAFINQAHHYRIVAPKLLDKVLATAEIDLAAVEKYVNETRAQNPNILPESIMVFSELENSDGILRVKGYPNQYKKQNPTMPEVKKF